MAMIEIRAPAAAADRAEPGRLVSLRETPCALLSRLERPRKCNAISTQVIDDLQEVVATVHASGSVKPFVLRGSGSWFSSGGDMRQFTGLSADEAVIMGRKM